MSEVLKALKKAQKEIKLPGNWCQRALARDEKGKRVGMYEAKAVRFCAYAALARATKEDDPDGLERHDLHHKALLIMQEALDHFASETEKGKEHSIMQFNDRNKHEQVVALYEKAIEIANEKGPAADETQICKRPSFRNKQAPRNT